MFETSSVGDAYRCIDPELLNEKHLEHNLRVDGRQLLESRPILISSRDIKSCDSSSSVRIGNTKVYFSPNEQTFSGNEHFFFSSHSG